MPASLAYWAPAIVLLPLHVALLWGIMRRLVGRPVGPSTEFAAGLRPRPVTPPAPPDPNREVWKPWFRLYGPLFLELKYATGLVPDAWRGRVHEAAAYRLYMEDRLPEALEAAEKALRCGSRAGVWAVKLLSIAGAEVEAREQSTRVEAPPFAFELPADDRRFDALVEVAGLCGGRVEALLSYPKAPTTFTLLRAEELRRDAGSPWGYLAIKAPYRKICLLRPHEDAPLAASMALVYQYVVLAVHELSRGCAPRWLIDGLGQWMVREVLDAAPLPPSPPPTPQLEPSSVAERTLELLVRGSRFDRLTASDATAHALVAHLIETYGEAAMAQFVANLAHQSEGRAFRRAFGVSQRRFEREWRRRAQKVA